MDNRLLIADLKNRLKQEYAGPVKDVILFGSQVNGNANEFSDYDMLIVLERAYSPGDENAIFDICYEMDLKYGILIDAHLISTGELNSIRGKQPLYVNALKKGLVV